MTDQDPYARGAQTPDDPSAPTGGSGSSGSTPTPPSGYAPSGYSPYSGGSSTRYTGGYSGGYPGGYSGGQPGGSPSGWSSPTTTMPPPGGPQDTRQFGEQPPGGGRSGGKRRTTGLVAAGLAAVLVAGGVGGAVGYEIASPSGGGSSVLSGAATGTSSPTGNTDAPEGSVQSVAQKVLPSVVQLRGASGEGSGIVISADGLILTNAHVLQAGQSQASSSPFGGLLGGQQQQPQGLNAVFQNGASTPVQVVGTNATSDLAVVRAQNTAGLVPAQLGDSSQLQVGQGVVAVGSPLGLSGTVTTGIVSALQRPVTSSGEQGGQESVISAVQTDAAINPGNSGGALVDMNGRVVGITSAIASLGSSGGGSGGGQSGSIGLGFAIPINQAARIGDQLARTGSSNQAVLGVQVGDVRGAEGATLGPVTPGGPAAAAGLQQGDIVTRLNDQVIDDADSLVAAVRSQQPGAPITLTVSSGGGAPRQVPVTLGTEQAPST